MKKESIVFSSLLVLLIVLTTLDVQAQVSHESELFKTLKARDSLLFGIGFNHCDLQVIASQLPENFEFIHDKDGILSSKNAFIATIKENLCGTGQNTTERKLVAGSLEVFPLYKEEKLYGAIQIGVHQFGGTMAKFTHLWLRVQDKWVLSKVLSYDHETTISKTITDVAVITLSPDEMSLYLGSYEFSQEFTLSIIQEDGKLFGDAHGQKVAIIPYGDHKFFDESQTMNLNFLTDNSGQITGLEIEGPDGKMLAKKTN